MILNSICDLENKITVTLFKIGLHHSIALVLLCTNFGDDMSNISPDIEQIPFLRTLNDLENKDMVTRLDLGLCLALVLLCTKFGTICQIFLQMFSKNHFK